MCIALVVTRTKLGSYDNDVSASRACRLAINATRGLQVRQSDRDWLDWLEFSDHWVIKYLYSSAA